MTPTPISARSLTPTSSLQQLGLGTGSLRTAMQGSTSIGNANIGNASIRGSTPVRSVEHRSCLGGYHYAAPPAVAQPGQIAMGQLQHGRGSTDASNVSSYSNSLIEAGSKRQI